MSEAPAEAPAPASSSSGTATKVRDLPAILRGDKVKQSAGDAPVVPIAMILAGSYLAWFGVHYWRDKTTRYPTDPVKAILQGKGIPAADREQPVASDVAQATKAAAKASATSFTTSTGPAVGSTSGDALVQAFTAYRGKVRYVWGGASPVTGWDCSGAINYVCCHDEQLDIPGIRGGDFDGASHGPNVASWLGSSLVTRIPGPELDGAEPGDFLAWGPNEHIGMYLGNGRMLSAEDPAAGTNESDVSGFFSTLPVILRLNAITQQAGGDASTNQGIAKLLAGAYGWSPSQDAGQFADLVKLWTRESNWSITATNPSSGAYGIPQALPAAKMASAGKNWKTSAATQIRWGLAYIKQTYGSPKAAWAHEQSAGWY